MYVRAFLFRLALSAVFVLAAVGFGATARARPRGDALRLAPMPLRAVAPSYLDLGVGVYDIIGNAHRNETIALDLEYRYGRKLFHLGPAIGLLANTKGGVLGYAGAYTDLQYEQFNLTPLLAVAGYARRGGEDLGGPFQFRARLELSYTILPHFTRVGIEVAHVGNAGIERRNPGDNEILLSYAVPLPRPF